MSLLLASSGDIASGVVAPEGVDFDGVNDYLSRSSDLTGNVDSKTFTFSAWVYATDNSVVTAIYSTGETGIATSGYFYIQINNDNNSIGVYGYSATGDIVLNTSKPPNTSLRNGWNNILVSVDLANVANRKIYINDFDHTALFGWSTYANTAIGFTNTKHRIGTTTYGDIYGKLKGRLSHLYLDYTYRDLSIEANRRLFITADGKPTPTATLKALNPILYLPMKDAATCHINEGTGGNFVQNGTLDTASRGANQDNCVASKFDGDDYLNGGTFSNSKVITFSLITKNVGHNPSFRAGRFTVTITKTYIIIQASNTSDTLIFNASTTYGLIPFKMINISLSINMDNQSDFVVVFNGKNITSDFTVATFTSGQSMWISQGVSNLNNSGGNIVNGELYFDTRYTNLSTYNPFWDADTNRPKPVRQVIAEAGIAPLVALPLNASNITKNYGTGGDFTLFGTAVPPVGARGGSEFWSRGAALGNDNQAIDGSLRRTSPLVGSTTSKQYTLVFWTTNNTATNGSNFEIYSSSGANNGGFLFTDTADKPYIEIWDSTGLKTVYAYGNTSSSLNTNMSLIMISIDITSTAKRHIYLNGVVPSGGITWSTYNTAGGATNFSACDIVTVGSRTADEYRATQGMTYFSDTYIDFSQEVNRNKFVDQLGYPKNLKAQIDAGVIPNPIIYLPFDEPKNLGKNLGTGGNFSVVGTVTQGADFSL